MGKPEKLHISLPEDFSFAECCWYLDRGYDDCGQKVNNNRILKAMRLGGHDLLVEIKEGKAGLELTILYGRADDDTKALLTEYVREWLDIDRDLGPFYDLLRRNKRLAYMPEDYKGLRLLGIVDLFESLAWSIIGQQINLRFAYTLKRRLVEKYGSPIEFDGDIFPIFPGYDAIAKASVEELRLMQFSRSKAAYLIGLAKTFSEGVMSRAVLTAIPDREGRLNALMKIKGIGVWTANYCLMKCLRDPACVPHGDTGLLTALANHKVIKDRKELEKIDRFFSRYRGWESYLVFYFWRSLSKRPTQISHAPAGMTAN